MITQSYTLSLQPGGMPVRVPCCQGDADSRTLSFRLVSGGTSFNPPSGATVTIDGTKSDGKAFTVSGTLSGSTATVTLTEQMTVLPGDIPCQLTIISGTEILGTARFLLCVQPSAISDNPDLSATDLSAIAALRDTAVDAKTAAAASADSAANSATSASTSATAAANSAASAASAAANAVSGKADKAVPSDSFNFAVLTADGNLADSGFGGGIAAWTPVVAGAASYTTQTGCGMIIGGMAIIQFCVAGEFAGDETAPFTITGLPLNLSARSAGGGHLSGYTAASNTVFSGWIIETTGTIKPMGQQTGTVEGDGNKWEDQGIYQKSSGGFRAMGTIAFAISDSLPTISNAENGNEVQY